MKIQLDNIKKGFLRGVPFKKILRFNELIWKAIASIVEAFKARMLSDGGTYEVNDTFETTAIDADLDHLLYPNGYKEGKLYSVLPEDGSLDYTVDRASTATRINKEGLIEVVPTNTPRIDYSTGVPVVLVEEQTTNLEVYSIFSTIGYAGYGGGETTLIENATIAPDGSNTATRLDGGASLGRTSNMSRIITVKKNTNYTYSYYIKDISLSGFYTAIYLKDTATGVADSISIPTTFNTDISKTDWTRITYTFNTDNNDQIYLIQPTRALNTGESIYVWGYQLEEGSKATSLIPTAGSTVTRLADTITNTNYLPQLTDRNTKYIETPTEKKLVINSDGDLVESTKYLSANQGVMAQADIDALAVDRVQYGVNDNIYSELKSAQDNNASLAMIAGKGEAGKLQSILPVPVTPYLGAELITNGTFDTDLSGWVVTGAPVVESGRLKLDQSVESQKLYQAILKVGKTYEISLDYETDGLYRFEGLGIVILDGIGSYNGRLVADSTIFNIRNHTSTSYGYFDNVSIKELKNDSGDFTVDRNSTATYVAKDGLIKTALANEPRFDFSGGSAALLVEPQSTNLFEYSEVTTGWVHLESTHVDGGISPDGVSISRKITSTGQGKVQKTYSLNASTTYTFSCWYKNIDATNIHIRVLNVVGNTSGTESGCTTDERIQDINTNSFTRLTKTFTTGDAGNYIIYLTNAINNGGSIEIWGWQLEQGSVATSYMPTAGSTVTRLKDVVKDALVEYNNQGVIFFDIPNTATINPSTSYSMLSLNDNNTSRVDLGIQPNEFRQFRLYAFLGVSGTGISYTQPTFNSVESLKVALRFKDNEISIFNNGVKEATVTGTQSVPNFDRFSLKNMYNHYFSAAINSVKYYSTALTDAQLISLTTI